MKSQLAAWLAVITFLLSVTIVCGAGALQRQAWAESVSGDGVIVTAEGLWLKQAVITSDGQYSDAFLVDTLDADARLKAHGFTTVRAGQIVEKIR